MYHDLLLLEYNTVQITTNGTGNVKNGNNNCTWRYIPQFRMILLTFCYLNYPLFILLLPLTSVPVT